MTDPIRVLHFADVHIGMENYGRTDPETGVSSRVRDFLRRLDDMIAYAARHEVDLAIFAGDAFKTSNPTPTYEREFAFRIKDLATLCPVVLLVGNHDLPAVERRASSIEIYETLSVPNTILGREYAVHQIETRRGMIAVATAPYPMRHYLLDEDALPHNLTIGKIDELLGERLAARLEALADQAGALDMPRILTGHFSVSGAAFGSERSVMLGRDVTVLLSALDRPVWDYVALGHIHKHQCLTLGRPGSPPVVYSGSLERVDFGEELDDKGFVWAEVTRGATRWEFVPVQARPFVTLRTDVRQSADPTQAVIDLIRRHTLTDAVVRVIITADPESEARLQDRPIQAALHAAGVHHIAAVQRIVERAARLRLGVAPEGLTTEELLQRYLVARAVPAERIAVLLDYARNLFAIEE